jgi:4-amino-4-deoxy-L-arabinose transferase-like glycosyltransferase
MSERSGERREALWVAALSIAPLLPFLGKALSIDAPVFVAVAHRILEVPADPFGFQMYWDVTSLDVAAFNRNPPLLSYWLAPWIALLGERDWVLNLAALPFPLLAGLSFLGIARRLAGEGLAPVLLLVTAPAFVVLAISLLLDVPLLAFTLAAVWALLRGAESGRAAWLWLAGAGVAAAGLTKYVGFSTAPLLLAGAVLFFRRRPGAWLRVMIPPALAWGAWAAFTAWQYGAIHFLGSTDVVVERSFDPRSFGNQLAAVPIWYGLALVFPVAIWARALVRGSRGVELAVAALVLGAAAAVFVLPAGLPPRRHPIELEERLLAVLGFAGGGFVWVSLLHPRDLWRGPEQAFLLVWLAGLLMFSAAVNWHVSAGDALLAAPPALLLLWRHRALRPSRRFAVGCAAFALALSLLLAAAERAQVDFYRDVAPEIGAEIGDRPGTRWFVGSWGFQHEMERLGFRPVLPPELAPPALAVGDWIATSRNVAQPDISLHRRLYSVREERTWEKHTWNPLRTTNPDATAGFYSHRYGYVPFAWSREPIERIQLLRVVAAPTNMPR